ncbi:unnamed protein product [Ambrosiozyma monospora]|uniref:Unnamed protein product n=1 Tax=Ambrosiozyma monospora TaxID=43982 RepID=A0ACB5T4R3_AMBMO|nr:unnamed protein product [Ambrosiozyma monospora]
MRFLNTVSILQLLVTISPSLVLGSDISNVNINGLPDEFMKKSISKNVEQTSENYENSLDISIIGDTKQKPETRILTILQARDADDDDEGDTDDSDNQDEEEGAPEDAQDGQDDGKVKTTFYTFKGKVQKYVYLEKPEDDNSEDETLLALTTQNEVLFAVYP